MKVLVYVEGTADRAALEALLASEIAAGRAQGCGVSFLPQGGKDAILGKVPRLAADHLWQHPNDVVIALPDLYPMSPPATPQHPHRDPGELRALLLSYFSVQADRRQLAASVQTRFRVHCLKHDLEVLLLAAPERLGKRLRTNDQIKRKWANSVEDQNGDDPPKRVVEALFKKYRPKPGYIATIDAPLILRGAELDAILNVCQQCFAPFVHDLRAAMSGGALAAQTTYGSGPEAHAHPGGRRRKSNPK